MSLIEDFNVFTYKQGTIPRGKRKKIKQEEQSRNEMVKEEMCRLLLEFDTSKASGPEVMSQ